MVVKPKKSMTSLDVMSWLAEVKDGLIGARVNNVQRVSNSNIFILKLYGVKHPRRNLVIEPGVRIHTTERKYPVQEKPDPLVFALRKYIRSNKIEDIKQVGFDRIVVIEFSGGYKLFAEFIPRGDIVLVDENNKILHATSYREMRDRTIKRGIQYTLPPHFGSAPDHKKCVEELSSEAGGSPARRLGLPPDVLEEAIHRAGTNNAVEICRKVIEILSECVKPGGWIVLLEGKPIGVYPYKPLHLEKAGAEFVFNESFDALLDEYFSESLSAVLSREEESNLKGAIKKLEKVIEEQRRTVEEYENAWKKLSDEASVLLRNREYIENILSCVKLKRKESGWENVPKECPGVSQVHPGEGLVEIAVEDRTIKIPVSREVREYINELFEKAKKLKKKAQAARQHLATLEKELKRKEEEASRMEKSLKKLVRRRMWYERFRWSFTRNGLLVIAGKDASQNEVLVRKYLEETDIFLHADVRGAAATILKTREKPSEEDLMDAAIVAACYSKAWKAGLKAVDVFWVKASQVSKTPPAGEYLPKGSFMIYGKKNYIRNVQLELTVGIESFDESFRFVVGSLDAVERIGRPLVIIEPGNMSVENTAKSIVNAAKRIMELPRQAVTELASMLPGPCRIKRVLIREKYNEEEQS